MTALTADVRRALDGASSTTTWTPRMTVAYAVVPAIACATRTPGIAIGIVAANLPSGQFAATIIRYAVFAGIAAKPCIARQRRRVATPAGPAATPPRR